MREEKGVTGGSKKQKSKKQKYPTCFRRGYREKPLVTTIKDPTFVKRITESLLNND